MAVVRSVNVGRPRAASWATTGRTSIDKSPVRGPVRATAAGLVGDEVSNRRHHGGPDKAVYAYAREALDDWAAELGHDLPDGQLGENLTVSGLDVDDCEIGERWEVGEVVLEVRSPRTPCRTLSGWMDHCGLPAEAWLRRFTERARPGAYLRVLGEGALAAGDEVRVRHRPGHGVTVALMFRAVHLDRTLLPRLLEVPDLVPEARLAAERWVAGGARPG
ncbi:MOSC domain-containing protein [Nocardioides sp. Leaf374]|uniref:MOSC domain-containing protein n=1 Tax=Nocardioides sp. Leaf374 TaxID=2876560 RepID=UPI001E3CE7C0|nr:MOSC domain-containing protein [Nocardioides sp. Leaf374]